MFSSVSGSRFKGRGIFSTFHRLFRSKPARGAFAQKITWLKRGIKVVVFLLLALLVLSLYLFPKFTLLITLVVLLFLLYNFSEKASIAVAHKYPWSRKYLVPILQYVNKLHVYEFDNQFLLAVIVCIFGYCLIFAGQWLEEEEDVVLFEMPENFQKFQKTNDGNFTSEYIPSEIALEHKIVVTKSQKSYVYMAITTLAFLFILFLQCRKDDWFDEENDAGLMPQQVQEKVKNIHSLLEARSDARRHITYLLFCRKRTTSAADKEEEIQQIFEETHRHHSASFLNLLIQSCKIDQLFMKLKDTGERKSRQMLIDFLCWECVDALNVKSKVVILHALMSIKLSGAENAEASAVHLVQETAGDDLSLLKTMTDAKGSVHGFHKLVFIDCGPAARLTILRHIMREGVMQVAFRCLNQNSHLWSLVREPSHHLNAMNLKDEEILELMESDNRQSFTQPFKRRSSTVESPVELASPRMGADGVVLGSGEEALTGQNNFLPKQFRFLRDEQLQWDYGGEGVIHKWRKVLSDIDDTMQSSGGNFPAGMDTRYPRHSVYPGCTTFFRVLEKDESCEVLVQANSWCLQPSTLANRVGPWVLKSSSSTLPYGPSRSKQQAAATTRRGSHLVQQEPGSANGKANGKTEQNKAHQLKHAATTGSIREPSSAEPHSESPMVVMLENPNEIVASTADIGVGPDETLLELPDEAGVVEEMSSKDSLEDPSGRRMSDDANLPSKYDEDDVGVTPVKHQRSVPSASPKSELVEEDEMTPPPSNGGKNDHFPRVSSTPISRGNGGGKYVPLIPDLPSLPPESGTMRFPDRGRMMEMSYSSEYKSGRKQARGKKNADHAGKVGHLVVLSARPHIWGDLMEQGLFQRFNKLRIHSSLHCMPAVLTGGLDSGGQFLWTGDMEPLAEKKFESFMQYQMLFPEFKFVFIGDNGQGDYATGRKMIQKAPDVMEMVYIHTVQPVQKTFGLYSNYDKTNRMHMSPSLRTFQRVGTGELYPLLPQGSSPPSVSITEIHERPGASTTFADGLPLSRGNSVTLGTFGQGGAGGGALPPGLENEKVYFFEDYIDAAIHAALVARLISLEGLWRVVDEAARDFLRIANWESLEQRTAEKERLNESIKRANGIFLGTRGGTYLPPVRLLTDADEEFVWTKPLFLKVSKGTGMEGIVELRDVECQTDEVLSSFLESANQTMIVEGEDTSGAGLLPEESRTFASGSSAEEARATDDTSLESKKVEEKEPEKITTSIGSSIGVVQSVAQSVLMRPFTAASTNKDHEAPATPVTSAATASLNTAVTDLTSAAASSSTSTAGGGDAGERRNSLRDPNSSTSSVRIVQTAETTNNNPESPPAPQHEGGDSGGSGAAVELSGLSEERPGHNHVNAAAMKNLRMWLGPRLQEIDKLVGEVRARVMDPTQQGGGTSGMPQPQPSLTDIGAFESFNDMSMFRVPESDGPGSPDEEDTQTG